MPYTNQWHFSQIDDLGSSTQYKASSEAKLLQCGKSDEFGDDLIREVISFLSIQGIVEFMLARMDK